MESLSKAPSVLKLVGRFIFSGETFHIKKGRQANPAVLSLFYPRQKYRRLYQLARTKLKSPKRCSSQPFVLDAKCQLSRSRHS